MRRLVGLGVIFTVLATACAGTNQAAPSAHPRPTSPTTASASSTTLPASSTSTTWPPPVDFTVPSTTIVTVPQPYHPTYNTLAELWRDSYEVERWYFAPLPGGDYSLYAFILPSATSDRGATNITAADLARYHMSPTGEYIVFLGDDEINHLSCLVGGYSRIFTVDPQTLYVHAVLPIWRGGTYAEFVQALDAVLPGFPTFTAPPSGVVAVYREAPMCAGNPTAQPRG